MKDVCRYYLSTDSRYLLWRVFSLKQYQVSLVRSKQPAECVAAHREIMGSSS